MWYLIRAALGCLMRTGVAVWFGKVLVWAIEWIRANMAKAGGAFLVGVVSFISIYSLLLLCANVAISALTNHMMSVVNFTAPGEYSMGSLGDVPIAILSIVNHFLPLAIALQCLLVEVSCYLTCWAMTWVATVGMRIVLATKIPF